MFKKIHYIVLKISPLIFSDLIRKIFEYWEAVKLIVIDKSFQNCSFHFKTQSLSLAVNAYIK